MSKIEFDSFDFQKYNNINNRGMNMKNKKGFIATSIIFSFFIVFLLIITINLTAYAQNRILMNQIKKDIKNEITLKYTTTNTNTDPELFLD
jgi:hypothetical protein